MNDEHDPEIDDLLQDMVVEPKRQFAGLPNFISPPPVQADEFGQLPEPDPNQSFLLSLELGVSLVRTRHWMLALAILTFALYGFGFLAVLTFGLPGAGIGLIHVVFVLVVTVVSMIPLVYMMAYASRIQNFLIRRGPSQFMRMVTAQCNMWTIMGIYSLVLFVCALMVLLIVGIGFIA